MVEVFRPDEVVEWSFTGCANPGRSHPAMSSLAWRMIVGQELKMIRELPSRAARAARG